MKIYGIDVSHHQGTINWKNTSSELRRVNGGSNPGFAILRAGYSYRNGKGGLNNDKQIANNISGCEKYDIPMGIYYYSYDRSPEASKITAEQVIKLISGHKFDYPIYIDVEYEPFNTGKDGSGRTRSKVKADNTAIIKAALEVFENAGYYAAVYCSRDFFLNYTNLSELKDFDKWEAAYGSSDTDAVQNGLWQYSSKNALGLSGFGMSLDCDVSYVDYPSIMRNSGLNGHGKESVPEEESKPSTGLNKTRKWTGVVTAFSLNVRTWAGVENDKCFFGPLRKNTMVFVCDTVKDKDDNDWYYINYNGHFGFVHSSYIKKV